MERLHHIGFACFFLAIAGCAPVGKITPGHQYTPDPGEIGILPGAVDSRLDGALVVYNRNAAQAESIARYYLNARHLPENRLCSVELPPGLFASVDELLGARHTLVTQCLCPLVPETRRPASCDAITGEQLASVSPITHLVIVRGIPARLLEAPWPSAAEMPSFDFYLSQSLYRSEDSLIGASTTGAMTLPYLAAFLDGKAMRGYAPPLDAALHRSVAYGRIEALTASATLQLIDRTIAAEQNGLAGNFLWSASPSLSQDDDTVGNLLRDVSGSRAPECRDYLASASPIPWPSDRCRAGATADGSLPAGGTVPVALNASLYLGAIASQATTTFDGSLSKLTDWRTTNLACTPLCSDLKGSSAQKQCRDSSTDPFREINTACVGTSPGFVGWQRQENAVQYYGFFPPGWSPEPSGASAKIAPAWTAGGAYQDNRFKDDHYLRFGEDDAVADPQCTRADGALAPCPERLAIDMSRNFALDKSLVAANSQYRVRVRFRYRNSASHDGQLAITLTLVDEYSRLVKTVPFVLPLSDEHTDWTLFEGTATASKSDLPPASGGTPAAKGVRGVSVSFEANLDAKLTGHFDLDGLELFDNPGNRDLVDVDAGSFNEPYVGNFAGGDYASHFIDRLGAVAWWGNSSKHLTGGDAFSDAANFAGAFFSGRSLGEAIQLAGNAMSGIVYGDPLYSPQAVKVFLGGAESYVAYGGADSAGYQAYALNARDATSTTRALFVNAVVGRGKKATTHWTLAKCSELTPDVCNSKNEWKAVSGDTQGGTGIRINLKSLVDLVDDKSSPHPVYLRLKAWNPGEETSALYSFAYLSYQP